MRRGHPGIGGWRNESPRHFRPRGGGLPRYGYPQQYPRLNPHAEFGLQRRGPRPHRGGLHYNVHSGPPPPIEHFQHDRDRFVFRRGQPPRLLDRDDRGERHSFPQPPPMRHNDNSEDASRYKHILNHCRINNMGDVDHRQNFNNIESAYKQHPVHQWPNAFQAESTSFDDRSSNKKPNRYHDSAEGNQFPPSTGHRPPSSDHYRGNVASAIDNSNSFSRSVDDTVDIVRKRLLNRNEPHNVADIPPVEQNPNESAEIPAIAPLYQNEPQTPPARKKIQRRQNVKSNCDKIKNKIVHQLFKMDKDKIHKLMDNPSSSTKFEYAISSLITESQNSLDRHLRSVAEKSLCRSSEEFIRNDNNTIYEDTFLKQMQCILEPQDTVLLEDIKPLVMAELTKVLQLDEFEQRFDLGEEDPHFYPVEEHPSMNYPKECETFTNEDFSKDTSMPEQIAYYQEQVYSQSQFATQDIPKSSTVQFSHEQLLYEQRVSRETDNANVPIQESIEDHKQAKKITGRECYRFSGERRISETSVPVFDHEKARKSFESEHNKVSDESRICESSVPVFDHEKARKSSESEQYKFSDERRISETSVPVFDRETAHRSSESEHYKSSDERRICETSVPVFHRETARRESENEHYKSSDERRICETSVPVFHRETARRRSENEHYKSSDERRICESSVAVFDREKAYKSSESEHYKFSDARRICETSVPVFHHETGRRRSENELYKSSDERRICETSVPVFDREADHRRSESEHYKSSDDRRICETSVAVFDREKARKSSDSERYNFRDERRTFETSVPVFDREKARKSADRERNKYDDRRRSKTPVPVFNANPDPYQLSEEEDPFADLDKQYHVPVDHTFIDEELDKQYMAVHQIGREYEIEIKSEIETEQIVKEEILPYPQIMNPTTVKKEIDSQILSIAKSPLKLFSLFNKDKENHQNTPLPSVTVKREDHDMSYGDMNTDDRSENQNYDTNNMDNSYQDQNPEFNNEQKESKRSQHLNTVKSTILPNARKRSIDQKPSHRKEKRKKSETTTGEANKQILNKNIIINVNDCGSKSTEKKCDSAKSIFNLFFSKDESGKELPRDNKNVELSDKGYSDKYVKRKETPKKNEHDSKRKRSSSTSHSIVSSKENNISSSETPSKVDAKNKLKPIDMFVDHPKKVPSTHQAHRNTAQAIIPKKVDDKTPVLGPKTKTPPPKRHIATQVLLKVHSKETQTSLLKSSVSKLCQTETKKWLVKATQTNPVTFEKSGIKSTDDFERMKEIDLEIQVLLQEKFKLYSSLESRESCSNSMHNLGMTVLNVTPIEEQDEVGNDDGMSADSIVDQFTSIPVEELEQIALESIQEITSESPKVQKRNQRQKVLNKTKAKLQSPIPVVNNKNKKKPNTPNISLIEQIITDDRPLEDIISLDDLEHSEDKQSNATKKKRPQRPPRAPKRKSAKKSRAVKPSNGLEQLNIRACSVVLKREDVCTYFNINNAIKSEQPSQKNTTATLVQEPIIEKTELAEISISNESADIQFDMLDVSEDIVIGTVCEVKSSGEKDGSGRDLSTSDDLILDNSQSSADDAVPADAGQSDECRMFDYSADEMLRRDSVTVTGNADAVLAIECIENNFIAACLDGNVYHFNGDGQLLATLRGSNLAVTCLTIVREKYGTTIYTGSLDSRIRYYDLDTGLEKGPECNVLSPIQTMDRAWDTVFVGTRTGFVLQFECKNNMLIPISTVKFSEQSILALRALKEGPRKVLLVAARSENVTIKDAQTGLLLRTLEGPKMTVYTLLFEDGKVYCGTSSHQIHTFDYASGSHCGTHEGGKGCVCLRATGGLLFAGCYDGCVYVFREGEPRPFAQLRGPGLMLLSLAVVGTKIIAGYKDRSLYIWKIPLSILREMIL